MDRHPPGLADRLQAPSGRQAAFVERVAGLVEHAHQRLGKIALVIARGDAHIVGHTAAEGVQGDVEATVVEVESHGFHEPASERLLGRQVEGPLQRQGGGATGLATAHIVDESGQEVGQLVEHGV